jgi:hypothetical protein
MARYEATNRAQATLSESTLRYVLLRDKFTSDVVLRFRQSRKLTANREPYQHNFRCIHIAMARRSKMRNTVLSLMIASGTLFAGSAAFADDTVIRRDEPPGIVVPLPIPQPDRRDTVIERRSPDCQTTTVHRENDRGDSKTVEKRTCD